MADESETPESGETDGGDRTGHGLGWSETAPLVHANVVAVIPGPFDVVLVFGREDHSKRSANGTPDRAETVRVGMSWGHLKSMLPLLTRAVADYEQQFGLVPAPGFDQTSRG